MKEYLLLVALLALAGASLVFFNALYYRKREADTADEKPFRLRDAKPGSFFTINGLGEGLEGCHILVTAKHSVQINEFRWFRLEAKLNHAQIAIDCLDDEDENLQKVAVYLKKTNVEELSVDYGLLRDMEEQEKAELVYEGVQYKLWLAGDTVYDENCEPQNSIRHRSWIFDSASNKFRLFVQMKQNQIGTVYIGKLVPEANIEIFKLD